MSGNIETGDMSLSLSYHLTVSIQFNSKNQINNHEGDDWWIYGDFFPLASVGGWDYAEDRIWPDTATLYIVGIS